jgi:hypothetical protein
MIKNWLAARTKENLASIKLKRTALAKIKHHIASLEVKMIEARKEMEEEESKVDVDKEQEELEWVQFIENIMGLEPNMHYVMITEQDVRPDNREMIHWLRGSSAPLSNNRYTPPQAIQDKVNQMGLKFKPARMRVWVNIHRTSVNEDNDTSYSYEGMEVLGYANDRVWLHDDLSVDSFIDELLHAPDIDSIETDGREAETYLDCVVIYVDGPIADNE